MMHTAIYDCASTMICIVCTERFRDVCMDTVNVMHVYDVWVFMYDAMHMCVCEGYKCTICSCVCSMMHLCVQV